MKYIYIFRHGETEYNKLGIMQGRSVDLSLNETGKMQTDKFYEYYKNIPFEIVISSDLKRSIESVKKFIDSGIPHEIDKRITEISWGANEGQPVGEKTKKHYKKMITEWANGNLDYSIPGGETGKSLVARIDSFVSGLKQKKEKYILVNTHGRALKVLITRLLEQNISTMENYKHDNTGLYVFEQKKDKFKMLKNNNTEHLK